MTDSQIKRAFLESYIVPQFYSSSHFYEMNGWSNEKVENFKEWLADKVCNDDPFREIMLEYIQGFEEQEEEIEEAVETIDALIQLLDEEDEHIVSISAEEQAENDATANIYAEEE
jgi:hypothetical protein